MVIEVMAYNRSYASKGTAAKKPWVKPPIVKAPRVVREWSNFQIDIFADIAKGTGNTQVDAYAGSGKSSSIVEGFYHVPAGRESLMCAFAKPIQIELEKKAPEKVTVLTLHSLGWRATKRTYPFAQIEKEKGNKLEGFVSAERGTDPETYEVRASLAKAVSLCKGYLAATPEEIDPILDRHGIDTCEDSREAFVTTIIKVMNACKKDLNRIDFDDMIWLPNVLDIKLDKYGMVFIDEAQDLNVAQINLAINSCGANGRIISVGDERQAIYGFRGADSNAIQNIVTRCNSKRLPLSVTYRCAKAIVQLAQTIVPDIQYAPNAEEGLVSEISGEKVESMVRPGDFILSRTNAPLIRGCLNLLKARIPANIQGNDMGKNLMSLIKRSKAKSVDSFLGWLSEYKAIEVERLVKAKRDPSILEDKVECLETLCEGTRTLDEVKSNLNDLFTDKDDDSRVILSTTHKAKGLERNRVFMLTDTYRPTKGIEEANLYYVAVTRARRELYLVSKSA
jgi:superfamily I DNA/RNA helicase